jgi:chemotaxis response regulator CheB
MEGNSPHKVILIGASAGGTDLLLQLVQAEAVDDRSPA